MSAKTTSRIKAAGRDDDLELERGEEREGIRPTLDQKGKDAFVFWTALLLPLQSLEENQAPESCHLPVVNKFHEARMCSVWYLSRAGLERKTVVVLLAQQVPALVLTHEHQSACYQNDFFHFCFRTPSSGSYRQNSFSHLGHQDKRLVSTAKHAQHYAGILQER